MKVFFDRFMDLITVEKDLGRQLRGKNLGVMTSSNGENLGDHFWHPFKAFADYLGIKYIKNVHTIAKKDNYNLLLEFSNNFKSLN